MCDLSNSIVLIGTIKGAVLVQLQMNFDKIPILIFITFILPSIKVPRCYCYLRILLKLQMSNIINK